MASQVREPPVSFKLMQGDREVPVIPDLVIPEWEDETPWQVPLHMLKPWATIGMEGTYPWCSSRNEPPIRFTEVRSAIREGRLQVGPMPASGLLDVSPRRWHIARIAHLAETIAKWMMDEFIEFDFGVPGLGYVNLDWPILDGNHRLAACFYKRVEYAPVMCCGDWEFGATCFREGFVG